MKKNNNMKMDIVFLSLGMIITGILFVLFPETTQKTICYIIAGILAVLGIVKLITYFRRDRMEVFTSYDLVAAAVMLIISVYVFLRPEGLIGMLYTIISFIIIADGFLKLQYSIDLLRIKSSMWLMLIIAAVVTIIAGIVVLLNPFTAAKVLMIFTGVVLIFQGAVNIITVIFLSKRVSHIREAMAEYTAEDADVAQEDADTRE